MLFKSIKVSDLISDVHNTSEFVLKPDTLHKKTPSFNTIEVSVELTLYVVGNVNAESEASCNSKLLQEVQSFQEK